MGVSDKNFPPKLQNNSVFKQQTEQGPFTLPPIAAQQNIQTFSILMFIILVTRWYVCISLFWLNLISYYFLATVLYGPQVSC